MSKLTLALVAHDHKKPEIIGFGLNNIKTYQSTCHLVATGTTGGLVADETGLEVQRFKSGPLGGDQQIGALIAENKLDALFFFWDPLNAAPHDPDVKALLRLCSVWNVPVACTPATADLIITSPLFLSPDYKPVKPSFQAAKR